MTTLGNLVFAEYVKNNATVYDGPDPNGVDDTDALQSFMDRMSREAVAEGKVRIIRLAFQSTYLIKGLAHKEFIVLDLNRSTLKKTLNSTGDFFTSPYTAVVRALLVKTGNSWYGSNRNMGLMNGTIDPNNKACLAVLDYLNVENFFIDGVTCYSSIWSDNWTLRYGGKNIDIRNSTILGNTRVFQDAVHALFGNNITLDNIYAEGGDDCYAFGNDDIYGTVAAYFDDQELTNFRGTNLRGIATRGNLCKVYCASSFPYTYTKALKVSNGNLQVTGKGGVLRNGGVSFYNHAAANNRVVTNIRDVDINANIEVGTDGTGIYYAVAGTLVGSPTGVSKANPGVVTLAGHGLTAGKVVTFINIPATGMVQLAGFYQVRSTNLAANTFELSDSAYRSFGLNTSSYATWTTGDLIYSSSGSGYVVGDILTPAGGTAVEKAKFKVVQIGPNGEVEAVMRISAGNYSVLPASPNSAEGGTGTGVQLFFETAHSGVNAYGGSFFGALNCSISGTIKINDTTGAATRFIGGYIVDSQACKFTAALPYVPALGGVQVFNEASTLKTKDNSINSHMVGNANMSTSYGFVTSYNADNTTISGLMEECPTNIAMVRPIIGGNQLEGKAVVSISAADPAVVTATGHGRKIGDFVTFSGTVLTAGDITNIVYRVVTVPTTDTLTLETLDGNPLVIAPATVSTPGTLYLSTNSVVCTNLTMRQAAGVTGVSCFNGVSAAPYRWTSLRIKDIDVRGIASPFAATVPTMPLLTVDNMLGYTVEVKEYRSNSVTHDALTSSSVVLRLPGATTMNAPTNPRKGQKLFVTIIQPAGGGVAVTWNAVFKKAADGVGAANQMGSTSFVYNGTNWVQVGGALAYA